MIHNIDRICEICGEARGGPDHSECAKLKQILYTKPVKPPRKALNEKQIQYLAKANP